MKTEDAEFAALMRRVREGSQEAVRELVQGYEEAIRLNVRRRLAPRLRTQFDSVDFVQDVWASFFAIPPEQYVFETRKELLRFLVKVACSRVADAARNRFGTHKHNLNRENSLDGSAAVAAQHVAGPEPSPSQRAIADETYAGLLDGLSDLDRQIILLLAQERSRAETAQELGVDEKHIRRLLERLARGTQS
jgi:RNA polymerase sigma-70 factor (ECF subfamily)